MDKRIVLFIAVLLASAILCFLFFTDINGLLQEYSFSQKNEIELKGFLDSKGMLLNDSLNSSISRPEKAGPGLFLLSVNETYERTAKNGSKRTLVRSMDVYVNSSSSEAVVAAVSVSTPNAKKEAMEMFIRQLNPS